MLATARIPFFPSVLLIALSATCPAAPPNILVIVVDDLGYGDLSSYGAPDLKSPNIDALVASGMRFDHFYANCPVCSPTRASILTGRYPEEVGVPGVIRKHPENNWGYLDPGVRLLPSILKDAGYATAAIGKWHLGLDAPNHPNDRGFDYFHGFLGDMMDDYFHHRRHNINYMRRNRDTIDPEGHATDLFTQWACDYLDAQRSQSTPFFLYLAYNAPHTPIQPPEAWLEKVRKRQPELPLARARLVALIEHCDDGIGKVIDSLKQSGQDQDTLIFFVSDNGGQKNVAANNGMLRDGKQSMYEGGIRVPMAAVWPGHILPGVRAGDQRGITMDIFETIRDAANAPAVQGTDGVSLLGLLTGRQDRLPARDLFFHRREGGTRYGGLVVNAVLSGEWKLLQNSPFASQELYHLARDPHETTNLAATQPQKFQELAAKLRKQVQAGGRVPWQRPPATEPGP